MLYQRRYAARQYPHGAHILQGRLANSQMCVPLSSHMRVCLPQSIVDFWHEHDHLRSACIYNFVKAQRLQAALDCSFTASS